jgi:hypothetical protein
MRLKEMSSAKQAGGKGETEKGNTFLKKSRKATSFSSNAQTRTRTTRQATQTQPLLLAADTLFAVALEAVPADDWRRTLAAGRTIMLRRTSKRVKETVDKKRLPAVVRLSRSFRGDAHNDLERAKLQFVLRQLPAMTASFRITTLDLYGCDMKGKHAGWLAAVLA